MTKLKLRMNLRIHFENGGAIIFVPLKSQTFELNETATKIMQLCDGKHSLNQIVSAIADEYGCNEIDVKEDVRETISALREKKIIGP